VFLHLDRVLTTFIIGQFNHRDKIVICSHRNRNCLRQ